MVRDTEMMDAGNRSDADSLASTVESDDDQTYEVEEILAERGSDDDGSKEYLLKWLGYPIHRASWEPPENFGNMEENLRDWEAKKRKIATGQEDGFDVEAWEAAQEKRERETQRRKRARRLKRAQRATRRNGKPPRRSASSALKSSRESSPDIPLIHKLGARGMTSRESHKRSASIESGTSALFVSTDDPEPNETVTSKGDRPTSAPASAPTSTGPSTAAPTNEPSDNPNSSRSTQVVTEPPAASLSQPAVAAPAKSKKDPPAQLAQPQGSASVKSSQPLKHPLKSSQTTKQDENPDKKPSQGPGQIRAADTESAQKPEHQSSSTSSSKSAKEPAQRALYAAFASNKSSQREPDISQLDLRKPSDFPARTAAGVPVPFAKMTASDTHRRGSHGVSKPSNAISSVSQAISSSAAPRKDSSDIVASQSQNSLVSRADGPGRSRPLSPPRPFGGDCYRPGESLRRSPPRRTDSRGNSPSSRRSRSPDRRLRSPEPRQRSPVTRWGFPDNRRPMDSYRPSTASPFVKVTRPKSNTPIPDTSKGIPPPATVGPPAVVPSAQKVPNLSFDTNSAPDAMAASLQPTGPPQEPQMSIKDLISRMPIGKPMPGAMIFQSRLFVNPGEVLAHVYFGPDKHFVGAVRLCGLSSAVKSDLLSGKNSHGRNSKFEMWFKHVYTRAEYDCLCRLEESAGGFNRVLRTAWMEGFADSNPEIFHMSDWLFRENKAAVYYHPRLEGYAWLAYSPKSPQFADLTQPLPEIDPFVPIRLAVRTPLPPYDALQGAALMQPGAQQQTQSPSMAMVSYQPPNPSIVGAPDPLEADVNRLAQKSAPSNMISPIHAQGLQNSPVQSPVEQAPGVHTVAQEPTRENQAAWLTATTETATAPADPRLRRLSSMAQVTKPSPQGPSLTAVNGPAMITTQHLRGINSPQSPDSMDTSPDNPVPVHTGLVPFAQNASMQQVVDPNSMLGEFFERKIAMPFKDLANVSGKREGPRADVFYLHTPEDEEAQNDCKVLKLWLELNGAMVWSDWAKFLKNSKCGIVLFHESFSKYHALQPQIRYALANASMGFWTYRISRPLQHPDVRYCKQGNYFQRLFNRRSAYLFTEDILQDLKQSIAILKWFHDYVIKKLGTWKLVLWPNLLPGLEEKLGNPGQSKDDYKLLGVLIFFIRACNSVSQPFHSDSLNPQRLDEPDHNILSLPVAGYGERSERVNPGLPENLTQAEHDADRLAESFAGWAIENAVGLRKLYIVSNCKNEALLKRWSAWGHIQILTVESFIDKCKINVEQTIDKIRNKMSRSSKHGRSLQSGAPSDRIHHDLSSPVNTPQTPLAAGIGGVPTPREPSADSSNRHRSNEWRPPQPQDNHHYAGPYR